MARKRIALVGLDLALPGEKGLTRVYDLAGMLSRRGWEVDLLTGRFQHWEKRMRSQRELEAVSAPFRVSFMDQLSYRKNIDPRRVLSYRVMARNVKKHLESNTYDLVYALVPDNHIAALAGAYAKARGIPFVVDVEDLWPEAMRMVLDVPVLSDLLFGGFARDARRAYLRADGVVGSSDRYRDEPLKYGVSVPKTLTVYVGGNLAAFDRGVEEQAPGIEKPEGEFWVTYAGTLGTSYDIPTLIRAADILHHQGETGLRILLLGDGPKRAEWEALAAPQGDRVRFLGYQAYGKMAAWLHRSDAVINSVIKKGTQSLPSKIGDYLASGNPLINTGLDPELCEKVEREGLGINVPPEDPEALAEGILRLMRSPGDVAEMGARCRRAAEEQFDRPHSYEAIGDLIAEFLGE